MPRMLRTSARSCFWGCLDGSRHLGIAAHGLLDALPVITVLGIGLAWLRYRQGSTIPGMILHGTFNGIALAASLLS